MDLSGNIAGFGRSLVLAAHPFLRYIWDESDDDDDEEDDEQEDEVTQNRVRERWAARTAHEQSFHLTVHGPTYKP